MKNEIDENFPEETKHYYDDVVDLILLAYIGDWNDTINDHWDNY